jgi:hypothetical protein
VIRPVGKTRYQLRRTPAKNGQIIGIMYEQDFRLTTLQQIKPMPRSTNRTLSGRSANSGKCRSRSPPRARRHHVVGREVES